VLYERAVALAQLTGRERVVDAYAGIGMLTARLGDHAAMSSRSRKVPTPSASGAEHATQRLRPM